jgi:hypothetical protein
MYDLYSAKNRLYPAERALFLHISGDIDKGGTARFDIIHKAGTKIGVLLEATYELKNKKKIGSLRRDQFVTQVVALAKQQDLKKNWLMGAVESMRKDEKFPEIVKHV